MTLSTFLWIIASLLIAGFVIWIVALIVAAVLVRREWRRSEQQFNTWTNEQHERFEQRRQEMQEEKQAFDRKLDERWHRW